jgi:regulator of sigma E protease
MNIFFFLLALSVLVFVHELGHFLMAKRAGILVEEFGIGLPPKLWSKRIGETIYSINALPIGGFVRMYGEEASFVEGKRGKKIKDKKGRSFLDKSFGQKVLVIMGGVLMNLLSAVLIFGVVYSVLGVPVETDKVRVVGVAPDSPADQVGLRVEDWVLKVNGEEMRKTEELVDKVAGSGEREAKLTVARLTDGFEKEGLVACPLGLGEEYVCFEVGVVLRENPPQGEGRMGVAVSNTQTVRYKWWQMPFYGVRVGFEEAWFWGKVILQGLGTMVGGLFRGQIPEDVAGPVGLYQASSQIAQKDGFWAVLHFFGVVSVNLGIVNALPLPALDGGRLGFLIWEKASKKKIKPEVEMKINNIGMLLLLTMMALVAVGDVLRIVRGG